MKAVVDTSALIFLSRLGRLDLLPVPCGTTSRVLQEVAAHGEHGSADRIMVDGLVRAGHLMTADPKEAVPDLPARLGPGEASVLGLASERGVAEVIVDDRIAIRTAKMMGLSPVSTAFLLLRARRDGRVSGPMFRDLLERLVGHGYYLSAPLYQRLIEAGGP